MALPIGIAAGMIKTASQFKRHNTPHTHLPDLASHVTFGSFTVAAREGNKEPVFWYDPETKTSINAVNLANFGLQSFVTLDVPELLPLFEGEDCKFRISLAPLKSGDLKAMTALMNGTDWRSLLHEVEFNTACPNHLGEEGLHPVLAHDPQAVEALLMEARALAHRSAIKIAPDMTDETLEEIIMLCIKYGVKTIVSANTRRHSSTIESAQRLSVPQGGLAGLPLLESGVKQVRTLRRIMEEQHIKGIKIVASGGILTAEASAAYGDAGAEEGQVATLFNQYGARGLQDLLVEMHS